MACVRQFFRRRGVCSQWLIRRLQFFHHPTEAHSGTRHVLQGVSAPGLGSKVRFADRYLYIPGGSAFAVIVQKNNLFYLRG